MTMVEKVARAIWEQRREFWPYSDPPLEEWGDGALPTSNGIFDEARAAIEAMRKPTGYMKMMAATGIDSGGFGMSEADVEQAWTEMICKSKR